MIESCPLRPSPYDHQSIRNLSPDKLVFAFGILEIVIVRSALRRTALGGKGGLSNGQTFWQRFRVAGLIFEAPQLYVGPTSQSQEAPSLASNTIQPTIVCISIDIDVPVVLDFEPGR